jgi:hypothetical protein
MKSGGPLKRNKPLQAKTGLRRTTELQRKAELAQPGARKAAPKRRRSMTALRAALAERSGGWCEMQLPGCQGQAIDPCHRVATGMGGVHGDAVELSDRLSNLVHGCRSCHDWTHHNPTEAERLGLILPHGADPLAEPVRLRYGHVGLRDDGGWVHVSDQTEVA